MREGDAVALDAIPAEPGAIASELAESLLPPAVALPCAG